MLSSDPLLPRNQLLAALPSSEFQRLAPYLEPVELSLQQILYEISEPITYVYFPQQGLVSLVNTMLDGATIEVGLVSVEGMVGLPVILTGGSTSTTRAFVQMAGSAARIKAELLKTEFNRGGLLQKLLLRYTQAYLAQVEQTAACNRLHKIEERLARWLLTVADRIQADEFQLTQEFIAQMLGVRRAGVTVAADTLQQAGILRYSRGRITILNREDLEATACECYGVIRGEIARILNTGND